jgi:DNA-binding SARP family transcriptional activator
MGETRRQVAIVGRLGVFPMTRMSLPGRRILAYLALQEQPVRRGIASARLWPDVTEEQGRANLRRSLWQLPVGWVSSTGEDLVLMADVDLPVARRAARRALEGGELSLSEIDLLSEDLLPGWVEEWAAWAQDAHHLLRVQALEAACRTMVTTGRHALATQAGAAAVAAEPYRESAAAALIDAHLAQRNRYEALQCFRDFARRLEEELGVAPDPSLVARIDGIHAVDRIGREGGLTSRAHADGAKALAPRTRIGRDTDA